MHSRRSRFSSCTLTIGPGRPGLFVNVQEVVMIDGNFGAMVMARALVGALLVGAGIAAVAISLAWWLL